MDSDFIYVCEAVLLSGVLMHCMALECAVYWSRSGAGSGLAWALSIAHIWFAGPNPNTSHLQRNLLTYSIYFVGPNLCVSLSHQVMGGKPTQSWPYWMIRRNARCRPHLLQNTRCFHGQQWKTGTHYFQLFLMLLLTITHYFSGFGSTFLNLHVLFKICYFWNPIYFFCKPGK